MFEAVESGTSDGEYATWEASQPVVVLGRNIPAAAWVDQAACRRDGIDVLRRCSGGGAVVLGHGCLNYAVAIPIISRPELVDVGASIRFVLQHIVDALSVPGLAVAGDADLVLGALKVSGNAQRRGRRAILQHGTLLYDFDSQLAVRYLLEPPHQPTYRRTRRHDRFITNLPITRVAAAQRLARACAAIMASSQRACAR